MKRAIVSLLIFSIIFCSLFCFASCSKEPDIIGRWETRQYVEEFEGNVLVVFNFDENGSVYIESANNEAPYSIPFGNYEVRDGKLFMESEGELNSFSIDLSEDKLILTEENGNKIEMQRSK